MPYRKVQDLSVQIERFDGPDGKSKFKYLTVGSVLKNEEGREILLLNRSFNPAGALARPDQSSGHQITLYRFDIRTPEQSAERQAMANYDKRVRGKHPDDIPFDDDVPF